MGIFSNFLHKMVSFHVVVAMIFFSVVFSAQSYAQPLDVSEAELFGVKLKDAKREDLRKACLAAGMGKLVFSEDLPGNSEVSIDNYDVNGQLDNALTLYMMFDSRTGEFLHASYEFERGIGIEQIIDMVSTKYGKPGILVMGDNQVPEIAWWPEEMADLRISVYRKIGKVSLNYTHFAVARKQANRKAVGDSEALKERAKAQSNAF